MVVQKHIDSLKERPKDEKKVVAGGVAITIAAVLFFSWAVLFFKRVQQGTQQVNLSGGAQDEFNFSSVREAQDALQRQYGDNTDQYKELRDAAAASQVKTTVQTSQTESADPFRGGN